MCSGEGEAGGGRGWVRGCDISGASQPVVCGDGAHARCPRAWCAGLRSRHRQLERFAGHEHAARRLRALRAVAPLLWGVRGLWQRLLPAGLRGLQLRDRHLVLPTTGRHSLRIAPLRPPAQTRSLLPHLLPPPPPSPPPTSSSLTYSSLTPSSLTYSHLFLPHPPDGGPSADLSSAELS
jgi:hypothetical protein